MAIHSGSYHYPTYTMSSIPPLIAHVIHHLYIGGLENGLINLINNIPEDRYRHAIICIDDFSDFRNRLQRDDVEVIAIHKAEGRDPAAKLRLFKQFQRIKPAILHSRNLSGLDALLPAYLAGINYRIHGEHGRDINDLEGSNRKLQILRRLHRPLIQRYIPLSLDLERYLRAKIGVKASRISQIYNGVDTHKFKPARDGRPPLPATDGLAGARSVIIGTVGRFQAVKDQLNLAEGFISMLERSPELAEIARLVMIGDGPLRSQVMNRLAEAGYAHLVWAPGARDDIHKLLQSFDLFVLPSLAEGISNTLLEAMSCGLPVVATAVGGNPELVADRVTGELVPAGDAKALGRALERYVRDKGLRAAQGQAGRRRVEAMFSIQTMVDGYMKVYDRLPHKV